MQATFWYNTNESTGAVIPCLRDCKSLVSGKLSLDIFLDIQTELMKGKFWNISIVISHGPSAMPGA